eukprot:TRINITY_DN16359_c0_g1_i1.p1 TRINITY_DN16359_c0_g1~~TRINITY_DN16359_c0_g1_i1.p1  ORF type:complete len:265 (+),score=57.53 TRINITY_DN16359_c0_g1_i1:48-797(+)
MDHSISMSMEHITAHAAKYFDIVRKHDERGLLWLVFVTGDDFRVKSMSFLPVEAVQLSQSNVLLGLFDEYKKETQFVCWYTLENESGVALCSKVVIVDSCPPQEEREATCASMEYSELVKMTLQITEAAGKMSAAIDSLNQRLEQVSERQQTIDDAMVTVLTDTRTAILEEKVARLERALAEKSGRGPPSPVVSPQQVPHCTRHHDSSALNISKIFHTPSPPTNPLPAAPSSTLDDMISKFEAKLATIT